MSEAASSSAPPPPEDKDYAPETKLDDESSIAKEEARPQADVQVRSGPEGAQS